MLHSRAMRWRVTYRGNNGKKAIQFFEADSRGSLFDILRNNGIHTIRVELAKDAKAKAVAVAFSLNKALWAGVSVASVIVCSVLILVYGWGGGQGDAHTLVVKKRKPPKPNPPIVTNIPPDTIKDPLCDPSIISIKKTINPFTGEEMLFTNRHKQVKANSGIISRDAFLKNKYRPKRKLFKHYSENYICGLMRTPLGMPAVRGRLPNNFDDDFARSYAEEIKIEQEDTEEDIALKQAMIDFKEEVKELIAKGESVSKIVLEAREEQNKLAEYRKNLMRTISDLRKEGATREELNKAREAANIMLDNKGLKRIPDTELPRKGEEE